MDDVHRNDASVRWVHVVVYAVGRNRMNGQNYDKEKALLAIQHLAGIIKEMHKSLETTTYEPARNYARRSIEACHWAIDILVNTLTEGEENERVD